ncbi:MAG: LysR substrate-binding domain-containing protein [Saccharospirillum sp.]
MAEWEGIREFAAVVEQGGFTAAARHLRVSVAHVSRQVGTLENRLDAKLLHRTTRKVMVTEAGQMYYQHCRHLLEGLAEAERALSRLQSHPSGQLRITAPVSYGERYIAPALHDFMQRYPDIQAELHLTNQSLDIVDQGFDLAIRLGMLEESRLVARKLAQRSLYVCASPLYLARHGPPHTLAELRHHNCLLGTLDHWRFDEAERHRNVRVRGSLRCNSGAALLDAALKGMGLVQLPDYYVEEAIAEGRLVEVLRPYREQHEGIWALYPPNRHLSAKVRLMVEYLGEVL